MDARSDSNGVVSIRPTQTADLALLDAGRDSESRRFLGDGVSDARPTFCIEVAGQVVGWVDFDTDRTWLLPGEANIGYNIFPAFRSHGYATRGVRLLFDHLAAGTDHTVATLLINPRNEHSIRVAERLECERQPDFDDNAYYKYPLTKPNSHSSSTPRIRSVRTVR